MKKKKKRGGDTRTAPKATSLRSDYLFFLWEVTLSRTSFPRPPRNLRLSCFLACEERNRHLTSFNAFYRQFRHIRAKATNPCSPTNQYVEIYQIHISSLIPTAIFFLVGILQVITLSDLRNSLLDWRVWISQTSGRIF